MNNLEPYNKTCKGSKHDTKPTHAHLHKARNLGSTPITLNWGNKPYLKYLTLG